MNKQPHTYQSTLEIKKLTACDKAMNLFNDKKYSEALDAINPETNKDYNYWNIKGLIFDGLKDYEKAIECFDRSLNLNQSNETKSNKAHSQYNLAKDLHFPQMDNHRALDIITQAIANLTEDDDASEFWFLKGEIFEGLGDNIEARKCFYRAENDLESLKDLENQLTSFEKYSSDTLINITGYSFYEGIEPFKPKTILTLIKEPDNEHDPEAIAVMCNDKLVGYVANSDFTVISEVKSASMIKGLFKESIKAEVVFIYLNEMVIARLLF